MTGFGTDLINSNVPSLGLTQDNQKANAWYVKQLPVSSMK